MTPIKRRYLLGLMGSSLLTGCVATPAIVSRASNDPFEGGIGGTGIVGLLTDFGSLMVNGLRVELTSATQFLSPFGPISESDIAVGAPLTILSNRSADRYVASSVQFSYPLVGPVALGPDGAITVNGAPVRPEPGMIGDLTFGTRAVVSGIWSPSGLIASRVDPAVTQGTDMIAGVVARGGPTGLLIEGVPVQPPGAAARPATGEYATAFGRHDGTRFMAAQLDRGRFAVAPVGMRQLSVEGFLEPVRENPGFRIAGLGHSFARDLNLAPFAAARTLYFGPYDGRFRARAGYVVPEELGSRRRLLRDGFDGGLSGDPISTR